MTIGFAGNHLKSFGLAQSRIDRMCNRAGGRTREAAYDKLWQSATKPGEALPGKNKRDIGKPMSLVLQTYSKRLCYCSGGVALGQVTRPPPDAWKRITASAYEQKLRTPLWFRAVGLPSTAYPTFGPVPVTTWYVKV